MRWYVAVLAFGAALTIGSIANAATILVKPAINGEPALVTVDGDLQANDGDQFRSKTSFLSKAIVSFRSAGGSVVAGIQIGESIRLKGFTTVVARTARCASACAIAWLGGTPRLMSPLVAVHKKSGAISRAFSDRSSAKQQLCGSSRLAARNDYPPDAT
jgi:hypothetical protein